MRRLPVGLEDLGPQLAPDRLVQPMEARQQARLGGFARALEVDGVVADHPRARTRRHDHHPIREGDRFLQIMGDEQHRPLARPQAHEQVAHDLPGLGIERPERLIHQQDLRVADQHLREADPLALAAGELMRIAVGERCQADALQPGLRSLPGLAPRHAGDFQADGDIVPRRLPRHDRVPLEEVAGLAVEAFQSPTEYPHLSGSGPQQSRCHVEQRRLAAPGRADDGDELARPDGQVGLCNGLVGAATGEGKLYVDPGEAHGRTVGFARRAAPLSRVVQWASFTVGVASFFDSVSKEWLVRFVEHRIGDKRIIRLIRKRHC
jgi:hypothetical protein